MSKARKAFFIFFAAFLQIFFNSSNSGAQSFEASIKIETNAGPLASVSGRNLVANVNAGKRHVSFLRSNIGAENLGDRVSDLILLDRNGKQVAYKKFIAGEFVAEADFTAWSYKIRLEMPKNPKAAAHISWLSTDTGILMLDDLLPQLSENGEMLSAKITLEIPDGWQIAAGEKVTEKHFDVSDTEKKVFVIGKDMRERRIEMGRFNLNLLTIGEWQFSDEEAAKTASEIYEEYLKIYGKTPSQTAQISILKFPDNVSPGTWEAETRGSSVTIISSDMPFKTQSLQRLREQMRHELFHLWLPGGVNLSGNYDWFFEGFALYQSLKTGVQLNQIRFDDFLDTLSRAHNIDSLQTRRLSLIEASVNRWNGADTQVYARGMLVAFLCDIALLNESKGKRSVSDIFRRVFEKHSFPGERQDGNAAVLSIMQADPELLPIIQEYVKGAGKIDWQTQLQTAGIESGPGNKRTSLHIIEKPKKNQKALLDKLGYNSWRKLSR
ncbi:MAG: hypothetical protein H0V90_13925 [Blastocatellia bacterium]|nr:hypothetical protein [Blastocatellia bacterium]